jgi:N-acetylglucosaminyl-diphospho-decaprenol L-rhamnosyltransferase
VALSQVEAHDETSINPAILDVVIVNWNSGRLLLRCVDSVFSAKATGFSLGKVIVVDNASTDDSLIGVEHRWPARVNVIRNPCNEGFGRACNTGARQGGGSYILFLNPDAELLGDSLSKVVAYLAEDGNEEVGVCGVKLIDECGTTARGCCRRPTARMFFMASVGLDRTGLKAFRSHVMTDFDHERTQRVGHVIGAMYLIRRQVFEEVGGFDESYFVYLEDIDLSSRVAQAGYHIAYFADSVVRHEGGGTSKAIKDKRLFYSLHSKLLYASKNFSPIGMAAVWLATLIVEPIVRLVVLVLQGRRGDLKHVTRAYRMLYRSVCRGEKPQVTASSC